MRIIYHPKVEDEIKSLPKKYNSKVVNIVDKFVNEGFSLSTNWLRKLSSNIWELRAGRYRLLFGIKESKAIITNIFIKKTQKTPRKEIELAVKRLKEYEKRT